ncbi:MAG: universal stress protein [Daejeonella sp.]|uniref:universal stress protein n=1 Tax=Daejeonella sp. TaxID=2805397 RepID=UPI002734A49F|nr:universal stress protein [Daejeonella sp.]MDP3468438.1 universal stress protein [Daejeonella sp.]
MKKEIKNILVAINFSNSTENAVKIGLAMCKRHNASLHLLKVNKVNDFPYPIGKKALLIGFRLETMMAEMKSLEKYAKDLEETHQIKCYYHIEEGSFSTTVDKVATIYDCELIVLEKKSGSSHFSFFNNRDVSTIIKTTSCPVLVVPENCPHDNFKMILFPFWLKKPNLPKLELTLPIIEKNASKVILFGMVKSPNDIKELDTVNRLMRSVHKLISITTRNIKTELEKTSGTAKSILKKAVESESDLIVISGHVKSNLPIFGKQSKNRFIINNASVPVLNLK